MNIKYASKLQDALIGAGKIVESRIPEMAPSIPQIELLYDQFLLAVDKDDLPWQKETSTRLIAALLKFQSEKL